MEKSIQKILVRSPNWIGDQVLAYPFFYFLRKAYPRAHIAAVCAQWVADLQYKGCVNEVIVLPRPQSPRLWDRIRNLNEVARDIRVRGDWDLGIALPYSWSAAWLLYRSGVERRRGFPKEVPFFFFNDPVPLKETPILHRSDAYLSLIPGLPNLPENPLVSGTEFWGTGAETEIEASRPGLLKQFDVQKEWAPRETLEVPVQDYYVVAPGSMAESRRWPVALFIRLIHKIHEGLGLKAVIVGGAQETALAQRILESAPHQVYDMTGRAGVAALWKVFRGARFSVCNDSGLAHVAALCGSKVHVVWGGGDPRRTKPIGPGAVQLSVQPVECWPCERNYCFQVKEKKVQCLNGLDAEYVWSQIKSGILAEKETTLQV